MATNPLKASKRKSKEESKQIRREKRAETHEVVDATEKIELRKIFENIGERNASSKLKELKNLAKRIPKLKLVVDNFNDDVAHLIKFEKELRKQDGMTIKEAIDRYNFNVREQMEDREKAERKREEDEEEEEQSLKRQRLEELAKAPLQKKEDAMTFGTEVNECVKIFRSAPWVPEKVSERVSVIRIKEIGVNHVFISAPSWFHKLLCDNLTEQTVDDDGVLVVASRKFHVKYIVYDTDLRKTRVVDISKETLKNQKKYLTEIRGSAIDKAFAFASEQPFLKNVAKVEETVNEVIRSRQLLSPLRTKQLLENIRTEFEFISHYTDDASTFSVEAYMSDMANILAYLQDPRSVFKRRLEHGFYLADNEFLHLTAEEKLETRDKVVLDFFKRLENYYRDLLMVSYLYQIFPSERRTITREPMQETILKDKDEINIITTIDKNGGSYDIREVSERPWDFPQEVQEKVRKMKLKSISSYLQKQKETVPVLSVSVQQPITLPNVYFFIQKAIDGSLSELKERQSRSEICKNCSHHILVNEYKTVRISDEGVPEVVKFCSSLCMDEGHD